MITAILIPLYNPGIKHFLLIKSVLSSVTNINKKFVVYIANDGPESKVILPMNFIDQIFEFCFKNTIEIKLFSFIDKNGYPKIYQELTKIVLKNKSIDEIHFIDQDDYCLPNRFLYGNKKYLMYSDTYVVDNKFKILKKLLNNKKYPVCLMETPAPGMTYSVPRRFLEEYIFYCESYQLISTLAHDYVISQIAFSKGEIASLKQVTMLYIQHQTNTYGYKIGVKFYFSKINNFKKILTRLKINFYFLNIIYKNKKLINCNRMHQNILINYIYKFLRFK